jgi:XTP/dITP diphosphohydrolase
LFELSDIARAISDKLVKRHPHVFGDVVAETASDVVTNWERIKRDEKGRGSLLGGIPAAMPALARAATVERKLASAGLGWADGDGVVDDPGAVLLAAARSIAASGGDPEGALRHALDRLVERVNDVERFAATSGLSLAELPPHERLAWFREGPPPV